MPKRKHFTIEYLHKLENEARLIAHKSRDVQRLWENNNSRLNQIRDIWELAMEQLRGYGEYIKTGQTIKPEWIEYCNANNIAIDYDFSDLLS